MPEGDNSMIVSKSPEDSAAGDDGSHHGGGKAPASKDKKCPYCHQAFTSSSLGRHLDQYLFKKKPDGIHDVDEIRRLRGNITRRQARTSGKRDSPDVGSGTGQRDSPSANAHDAAARPREGPRLLFNTPSWHSTGVINDIPDPSASHEPSTSSRPPSSLPRAVSTGPLDYASRGADPNSPDTARALELALREVLDNIKAATVRSRTRLSPFEFEVQAQTFPALVLHMLPPPPTLFAAHPFPISTSFPLEPPGVGQVEEVRRALRAHIDQWRNEQLATTSTNQSGSRKGSVAHDPNLIHRTARQHEEMSSHHLDIAYQNWMLLPTEVKRDKWQLEVARAFAQEWDKCKKLEDQLARVQQEANQLREQVGRLGSYQWPREFAIFPPDMLPLSREAARELDAKDGSIGDGSSRWDYENVLAKWKRVVMHDKGMGRVGVGSYNSDDLGQDSLNRRKLNATSPDNHNNTSHGHASTHAGSSYHCQDAHRNAFNGLPVKRQRLMIASSKDAPTPEGENYTSTGSNVNGTSSAWSPNSVQSLLTSDNVAATTSTPPSNRFGIS